MHTFWGTNSNYRFLLYLFIYLFIHVYNNCSDNILTYILSMTGIDDQIIQYVCDLSLIFESVLISNE